jgi:hypothetical protein
MTCFDVLFRRTDRAAQEISNLSVRIGHNYLDERGISPYRSINWKQAITVYLLESSWSYTPREVKYSIG